MMEDRPLVSVVIPVWNGEHTLARCLNSVQCQTWQNLEIIVVDDGSTDGTAKVLETEAAKDPRIHAIHQENAGVSKARNHGIAQCRGVYTRFVDADDVLPMDSIEHLVRCAEENHADLVLAAYTDVVGHVHRERALVKREYTVDNNDFLRHMNRKSNSFYYGVLWNKLFRTEIIRRFDLQFVSGLSYGEDMVFVCSYLEHVKRLTFTRKSVYEYIRNPKGMTAHQALDSLRHPARNIRVKFRIYAALKQMYCNRGAYEEYRHTLWLYLLRVTVDE